MSCMTLEKELGVNLLTQANEAISEAISAAGGGFEIKVRTVQRENARY